MPQSSKIRTSAKIRTILETAVNALAFSIFIFIAIICIYGLFDIHQVENDGAISNDVKELAPKKAEDTSHSISELQKINPDILAWITIDNTTIDFPIVQTTNNSKYLSRNYKNEYSATGAAFLDYQNDAFSDDYSLVYGHRASKKIMFSEITSYKDKDFFDSHLTGKLYAIDTVYDLKVLGFSIVDASSWHYYNLDRMKNGHNQEIIQYIRESGQNTQLDEAKYEKLLLLSTCDKDSKHYRNIILLSMTPRD